MWDTTSLGHTRVDLGCWKSAHMLDFPWHWSHCFRSDLSSASSFPHFPHWTIFSFLFCTLSSFRLLVLSSPHPFLTLHALHLSHRPTVSSSVYPLLEYSAFLICYVHNAIFSHDDHFPIFLWIPLTLHLLLCLSLSFLAPLSCLSFSFAFHLAHRKIYSSFNI